MLASINPLGERARDNRWWLTAGSYLAASTAAGAAVGSLAGGVGWALSPLFPASVPGWLIAGLAAAACWVAAAADLWGRSTSGPRRQVNEDWLTSYRGWVYGVGFGAQLGAGLFTIVTTATVYLWLGLALLSGSPAAGAVVGVAFGLSRAAPVVATAGTDGPEALRRFHRRMQGAQRTAKRLVVATAAAAGAAIVVAGAGTRLG